MGANFAGDLDFAMERHSSVESLKIGPKNVVCGTTGGKHTGVTGNFLYLFYCQKEKP